MEKVVHNISEMSNIGTLVTFICAGVSYCSLSIRLYSFIVTLLTYRGLKIYSPLKISEF